MESAFLKKSILEIFAATITISTLIQPLYVSAETNNYTNKSKLDYISETDYINGMNKVEKSLDQLRQSGYFTGKNNLQIYYEKYLVSNAKAAIVISHGFSENITKYHEVIYYFTSQGYSVFGLDHRGHGRSGRLGGDATQTSVEDFDYYIDDLKTFMDQIVLKESTKNFLYAHSMGGGIAALFLERYSNYFKAAVLNAPMMDINTGKIPKAIVKVIATVNQLSPLKYRYVPGHGPYSEIPDFENSCTTSKVRYDYYFNQTLANKDLRSGGASYLWFKQALDATHELTQAGNASKVTIPVILFQAENDSFVQPAGHTAFANAAKNCKIILVKKAKHEIYRETDSIMKPYFEAVFKFLADNQLL